MTTTSDTIQEGFSRYSQPLFHGEPKNRDESLVDPSAERSIDEDTRDMPGRGDDIADQRVSISDFAQMSPLKRNQTDECLDVTESATHVSVIEDKDYEGI